MSNSAEVRSLLDLPAARATPAPLQKKPSVASTRKPEGISRELFSLIGPSSTTLVTQLAKPRLKQKPNFGASSKVKWEWRPFKNGGRADALQLKHWAKASVGPEEEYQFAKYNVQRPTYTYSQEEYTNLLEEKDWTKEETDYLMNIVQEYDTRWYVIHDRYDFPGGLPRSMEDLKDRYCSVCRKLVRTRPWGGDEASKQLLLSSFNFEKDREVLRKKYITSLENRTPEQIAEEEALYMEIKRLEQNERRFKRERDDLLRTIAGIESGLPDVVEDEAQFSGIVVDTKRSKKKGGNDLDSPSTPLLSTPIAKRLPKSSAFDLQNCITRSDPPAQSSVTKAAHQPAFLRSFKIPYPKAAIAPKVTQALAELGVSHTRLVMPTAANVALLESLLDATANLVETKKLVDKLEYDIQVLQSRLGMQGSAKMEETEETDGGMDVDDADGEADDDGRAQSVVSTRSTRKQVCICCALASFALKHGPQHRRSVSISSVDTAATVSTRAGTKRQRRS
ncbi:hypothetical protein GGX14DRAFT_613125 [Mycena pura]|uniref:SWR1-complex protein 4 n=1 Tax=Mycena pura TaxID=153505 RepID=A0AAD6YT38_9AGAR|nr:hypothetical protein GGX14DRAFT_613125 [Mycena pura]